MKDRLLERVFGIGLILILISFSPFVFPGLYIDTTGNFGFIALFKIILLGILNLILSGFWILDIYKAKKLNLFYSNALIPILVFLLSSIITVLSSSNQLQSFFGYNFMLSNSFVETALLICFFFLFINLITRKEQIIEILRFFLIGICIATTYSIIRYSTTLASNFDWILYYINNVNFTLVGNTISLLVLSIIGLFLGIAFLINDLVKESSKVLKILDYIAISINGVGTGVFLNINSNSPQYAFLGLIVLGIGLIIYFILGNNRLQKWIPKILIFLIIPLFIGICINYFFTSSKAQPNYYPSESLNSDWEITIDSLDSPQKAVFGNGQGSFANLFDKYSSDSFYQDFKINDQTFSNFITTSQSPITEEARIYEPNSYILGVLVNQGILGIISFIGIIFYILYVGFSKKYFEDDIIGLFSFFIFVGLSLSLLILRNDFIISLSFWLFLGIFLILTRSEKDFKKIIGAKTFILPIFILVLGIGVLWAILPLLAGNFYLYNAKIAQLNSDKQTLLEQTNLATKTIPNSDLFLRENAFAKNIFLFEKYNQVNKTSDTIQIQNFVKELPFLQNEVIDALNSASRFSPNEYKNYYFAGLTLSNASEFTPKLTFDSQAANYFNQSIAKNPHHADSYYQLAKIYSRQGEKTAALNLITQAIVLREQNIQYIILYADILNANGDYPTALNIYSRIKELKNSNPGNNQLQNFYQNQNIDKKISDIEKTLEAQKK